MSQNARKSAVKQPLLEMALHKQIETTAISTDMIMWKGEMFMGPTPRQSHRQLMTVGRRINFFLG